MKKVLCFLTAILTSLTSIFAAEKIEIQNCQLENVVVVEKVTKDTVPSDKLFAEKGKRFALGPRPWDLAQQTGPERASAVLVRANFNAPSDGFYRISAGADKWIKVWVDGVLRMDAVDAMGCSSSENEHQCVFVELKKGKHKIEFNFARGTASAMMELTVARYGNTIDKSILPEMREYFVMPENDFEVFVNGKKIELYQVMQTFVDGRELYDGQHYEIGSFDSDKEVEVEIRSNRSLARTVILPEKANVRAERTAGSLRFKLSKHGTYVFEPQTYKDTPLILFFNETEKNVPDRNDPKVRWFGPGVHSVGKIELHDGETLYLAPGAIVEASLVASGKGIKVCGRGILTQRKLKRGDVGSSLNFVFCEDLSLSGFIAADPCAWHVVLRDCRNVTIDNVKVCGGRMLNDDGIDVCNSRDVTIRNSFVRAQDDVIAVKGLPDPKKKFTKEQSERVYEAYCKGQTAKDLDDYYENGRGVSNVLVEGCVFWSDMASVFRIGYECIGASIENVTARNCDVVHVSDVYRPQGENCANAVWYIQPSHKMPFRNFLFEDVRCYVDVPELVIMKLTPMECPPLNGFGSLTDCVFRNVTISGSGDMFKVQMLIEGHDENSKVRGVVFDNFTVFGKKLTEDAPYLTVGKFADAPVFK